MTVRISATHWVSDGLTAEDAVAVAAAFKETGCDVLDVSAGQVVPDQKPVDSRLFQTLFSERIRLVVDMPTMTVGNIQSFADADSVIAGGRADICMMVRMHLLDPDWTRYAANDFGYLLPCLPRTKPLRSARRDGCHLTRLTGPGTRSGRTYWGRSQFSSIGYVSRSSFRGR